MSGGADAEWRKKYMKSTYTATNDDVNPGAKRWG